MIPVSLPTYRYVALRSHLIPSVFLPMPFALNCMMVNEFTSTACVGIDGGRDCSFGGVGVVSVEWVWICRAAYQVLYSSALLRFEDHTL